MTTLQLLVSKGSSDTALLWLVVMVKQTQILPKFHDIFRYYTTYTASVDEKQLVQVLVTSFHQNKLRIIDRQSYGFVPVHLARYHVMTGTSGSHFFVRATSSSTTPDVTLPRLKSRNFFTSWQICSYFKTTS